MAVVEKKRSGVLAIAAAVILLTIGAVIALAATVGTTPGSPIFGTAMQAGIAIAGIGIAVVGAVLLALAVRRRRG